MRDPLNELRDLSGATSTRPLPPEEVRRRGDRMRKRRTSFQAIGAAAAVAVIAGGGMVANGSLTTGAPEGGFASEAPRPTRAPSTGPSSAPAEEPAGEIPQDFPLSPGLLPVPDDLPAAIEHSDTTGQAWEGLPCRGDGRRFPADDARTAARGVSVQGDFWSMRRQLVVYADASSADRALSQLASATTACAASDERPAGAQPIEWEVGSLPGLGIADESSWVLARGSDTSDGSHLWYAEMFATRVGRAVVLTTRGRNEPIPDAESLEASHGEVVRAMCLWAESGCQAAPAAEPTEETAPALDDEDLISAGDIPRIETTSGWRAVAPQELPTLSCQPEWLATLAADEMGFREFRADDEHGVAGEAATAVLQYPDPIAAEEARATVEGWLESCTERIDEQRHPLVQLAEFGTVDVGEPTPARWRHVVTAAHEVCTDCGAMWEEGQGVLQVGDRLVLVSVSVQAGGPTPPGFVERIEAALRSAAAAARS